jgi:hypothetical protein
MLKGHALSKDEATPALEYVNFKNETIYVVILKGRLHRAERFLCKFNSQGERGVEVFPPILKRVQF